MHKKQNTLNYSFYCSLGAIFLMFWFLVWCLQFFVVESEQINFFGKILSWVFLSVGFSATLLGVYLRLRQFKEEGS